MCRAIAKLQRASLFTLDLTVVLERSRIQCCSYVSSFYLNIYVSQGLECIVCPSLTNSTLNYLADLSSPLINFTKLLKIFRSSPLKQE